MEHYSVHLDQYISLTSFSSGNFLTPWNISAAVLLLVHGVQPKQTPESSTSGPNCIGAVTLLAPVLLGMGTGIAARADEPSLVPNCTSNHHHGIAQPHWHTLLSQHRGTSLHPSTVRNRKQSSLQSETDVS